MSHEKEESNVLAYYARCRSAHFLFFLSFSFFTLYPGKKRRERRRKNHKVHMRIQALPIQTTMVTKPAAFFMAKVETVPHSKCNCLCDNCSVSRSSSAVATALGPAGSLH